MKKIILLTIATFFLLTENISTVAQGSKPLYDFPLGVQAYTFRKSFPVDVAKTLDTIKMMGFTEMEGGGGRMSPEAFKKLCDERGISIPSTGAGYEELVRAPDSVIYKAKILGAKYVMCAWIPHDNGVLTFENARKAVDDFNRIGKLMKDQGLIFCYHAHGYEFQPYGNSNLLDYIFKNTNPEYVSFEMDIFWMQFGGGDPVALLKKYGNRWKLIHLKDLKKGAVKNHTGLTGPENNVPLGQGEIDIPGILKEAKKIGIKHYFIEDESNYVNTQVPESIRYLKSLTE
ncbi:MAG TPA: sugar phosphate isomerase/epimerase [Puia sp.]|nr:sugar phosphate isomerase/epimerase [Puia sp.]